MKDVAAWEKDFLTNCYPRIYLGPFLENLRMESRISNKPFSVMIVDLDHFKSMNDKYGHPFGDDALKYFSSTLRLTLETDYMDTMVKRFIFRYGGDEFVIVFPEKDSKETYAMACILLKNVKNRPFLFQGGSFKMSFSGGIATFPYDGEVQDLVATADKALYFSKKHGKGKVAQFSKIKTEEFSHLLMSLLKIAILVFIVAGILVFRSGKVKFTQGRVRLAPVKKKIEPSNLVTVYLNTGAQLRVVVVKQGDPLELKMFFNGAGEGTVTLKKSEISRIVPDK